VGRRHVGGSDGVSEFEGGKAGIIDGALISTSLEIRGELIVKSFCGPIETVQCPQCVTPFLIVKDNEAAFVLGRMPHSIVFQAQVYLGGDDLIPRARFWVNL